MNSLNIYDFFFFCGVGWGQLSVSAAKGQDMAFHRFLLIESGSRNYLSKCHQNPLLSEVGDVYLSFDNIADFIFD